MAVAIVELRRRNHGGDQQEVCDCGYCKYGNPGIWVLYGSEISIHYYI